MAEASDTCGCQSLFCEELEIEDSQEGETGEAEEVKEKVKDDEDGEKEDEASQGAPQEDEDTKTVNKADYGGFEQKNRKWTQTEKATEYPVNIKKEEDGVEDKPEAVLMSPEANSALTEPPVGLITNCDLSEPVYLGYDGSYLDGPPAPEPMEQLSQNPSRDQLARTKRSPGHSSPGRFSPQSQQALEPPEAIAQVYSIQGHPESCPVVRKKTRTFYSTDMLEHLEALFQQDHYPDGEKRKVIAASVGLSPQRIMVWFQNRRAKWRKAEGMVMSKRAKQQKRAKWNLTYPQAHLALPKMTAAASSNVGPVFSGHVGAIPPLEPVPPLSTVDTHSLPSCSQMLPTSSGQSKVSEQPNFQPPPMPSPPPLRRASLPPLSSNLTTPMPTQPLFMDDCYSRPLQMDASCQFNFDKEMGYLTPGHQSNPQLSFQQQILYSPGQPQLLPTSMSLPPHMPFPIPTTSPYLPFNPDTMSTSLPPHMPFPTPSTISVSLTPHMHFPTPSSYLLPNPDAISVSLPSHMPFPIPTPSSYLLPNPDAISTSFPPHMPFPVPTTSSYLFPNLDTFSTSYYPFGHADDSTAGHNYVQSQGGGPTLLQPPNDGGYQSYPWPNMYAQPRVGQLAPNYTAGFANAQDLQIPSTSGNMPQCFPRAHGDGSRTILPPVSTLKPSRRKDENGIGAEEMAVAPLPPSQASPGSPRGTASSSFDKVENDSP